MVAYLTISCVLIAFDILYLAARSYRKRSESGKHIGNTCVMAGIVNLFYAVSVFSTDEQVFSVFSSLYFCSIDVMLWCFYCAAKAQTGLMSDSTGRAIEKVLKCWTVIDLALIITNPIHSWAVTYIPVTSAYEFPAFVYNMKWLYQMHLIVTYIYVVCVLLMLNRKAIRVPWTYRHQYVLAEAGVIAVVAINCVFLFLPGDSIATMVDWSQFGYSIAAFAVYWSFFEYSSRGMLTRFKNYMFDHIDSGLVMYDYSGNRLVANQRACELLPDEALEAGVDEEHFAGILGITLLAGAYSAQIYVNQRVLRVDIDEMLDKQQRRVGRIFNFKDTGSETDILTGFQKLDSFLHFESGSASEGMYPAQCAVLDIDALQKYNIEHGRSAGDMLLSELSGIMREKLPEGTCFVRGSEAELVAICSGINEDRVRDALDDIVVSFSAGVEYSLAEADGTRAKLSEAIAAASRGLRVKKLLNKNTGHADNLSSLIQALQECDPDTEEHVKRTRRLGDMLGRRIGLSDVDLSNLSLLCLLHDIGKIGIPLEILNKPGRLTGTEWTMLKTHVKKGYQIAMSSRDTQDIAEMVLHHHERWDGNGYPDGIKGTEIPLLSRIISVVDAFDAMVNDRVYRKAMRLEDAYNELKRCSGTQFDPHLVDEFVTLLEEKGFVSRRQETGAETGKAESAEHGSVAQREVFTVDYARYRLDANLYICEVYEGFEKLTGYNAGDIKEHPMRQTDLIPDADIEEYCVHSENDLRKEGFAFLEHRLRRKDGKIIRVLCYGKRYYDSSVMEARSEIIITEIAFSHCRPNIGANEAVGYGMERDTLTGLYDERTFTAALRNALGFSNVRLLVMFLRLADTAGGVVSDEYLVCAAKSFSESIRGNDIVCRVGENCFACIAVFDADVPATLLPQRSGQLTAKVKSDMAAAGCAYRVDTSVILPGKGDTVESVLKSGMDALDAAK